MTRDNAPLHLFPTNIEDQKGGNCQKTKTISALHKIGLKNNQLCKILPTFEILFHCTDLLRFDLCQFHREMTASIVRKWHKVTAYCQIDNFKLQKKLENLKNFHDLTNFVSWSKSKQRKQSKMVRGKAKSGSNETTSSSTNKTSKVSACALGPDGCKRPDGKVSWVCCDGCEAWYHCNCVSVDPKVAKDIIFHCKTCQPLKEKVRSCTNLISHFVMQSYHTFFKNIYIQLKDILSLAIWVFVIAMLWGSVLEWNIEKW